MRVRGGNDSEGLLGLSGGMLELKVERAHEAEGTVPYPLNNKRNSFLTYKACRSPRRRRDVSRCCWLIRGKREGGKWKTWKKKTSSTSIIQHGPIAHLHVGVRRGKNVSGTISRPNRRDRYTNHCPHYWCTHITYLDHSNFIKEKKILRSPLIRTCTHIHAYVYSSVEAICVVKHNNSPSSKTGPPPPQEATGSQEIKKIPHFNLLINLFLCVLYL